MDRIYVPVLCLFLCLVLESGSGEKIYTAETSHISKENQRNGQSNVMYKEQFSNVELHGLLPCTNCYKRKTLPKTSIADIIISTKTISPSSQPDDKGNPTNQIVPKESEKIEFSRKYNPDIISADDGFVPIPGPYGMKTRLVRTNALKSPAANTYQSGSTARNINGALKSSRNKSHSPRNIQNNKRPQSVQRRVQYRGPKVQDELAVKESITNENILGNGNFEIIRGGIYSDQDANEILGSRRIGRGFGSYVMPTYRQNRFNVVQNVQFPPFYQGRVQNPLHPIFYPRAPY